MPNANPADMQFFRVGITIQAHRKQEAQQLRTVLEADMHSHLGTGAYDYGPYITTAQMTEVEDA